MITGKIAKEYIRAHPKSQKLHERAVKVFAADGSTHAARILDPSRPYITHAKGSRVWDVDGNEYIDYKMGGGSLLLGHSHPDVVRAVQEQIGKGALYHENHELEIEWAELIKSMMPSTERVEFLACGQEANIMAIRLARIFTGRRKVLRFERNFFGWADELAPPDALGVLADEVKVIPGNDLNLLKEELATKKYAILMMEGGGALVAGRVPWEDKFVQAVPGLTQKYGTVWLVDEVITGFRFSPGGWQAILDVRPDLTSLGKCLAGGLPGGALVGRADIMDALKPKAPPQRFLQHWGTWNGNPLSSAAGIAACKLYRTGKVQEKVDQLGAYLRKRGNQVLKEKGINGRLYGSKSIIHLYLGPIDYEPSDDTMPPTRDVDKLIGGTTSMGGTPVMERMGLHLLQRGVACFSFELFFFLSSAHTEEDIDQTIKAFGDSIDAMIAEGTLSGA